MIITLVIEVLWQTEGHKTQSCATAEVSAAKEKTVPTLNR